MQLEASRLAPEHPRARVALPVAPLASVDLDGGNDAGLHTGSRIGWSDDRNIKTCQECASHIVSTLRFEPLYRYCVAQPALMSDVAQPHRREPRREPRSMIGRRRSDFDARKWSAEEHPPGSGTSTPTWKTPVPTTRSTSGQRTAQRFLPHMNFRGPFCARRHSNDIYLICEEA